MVAADPWLTRLRPGWLAFLTALTAIPLLFIASRPPVEVKPETLRTAVRLRALLATLPDDRQILVQRADLGWTVLWGINDADPRIVFDRVRFAAAGVKELGAEEPSPIADRESAARFFAYRPELACAVGVSKPGIVDMARAVPPSWSLRWSDEKYSLYCAVGFGE